MSDKQEKRGELRLASHVMVCLELDASPEANESGRVCITKTVDVSANGIQLISDFLLPEHSIHALYIEISELKFNLVGEVMWISPTEDSYLIGFQLIESEQTDIEHWKRHICLQLDQ